MFPNQLLGDFNASQLTGPEKGTRLYNYCSLIIYYKPGLGFYAAIMKLVGSKIYNDDNRTKINSFNHISGDFDGILLLEHLNGTFIKGRRYRKGLKPTPISIKPIGPNTEMLICDQVTVSFYQQVCVGGVCGDPKLLYTRTYLENCQWYPEAGEEPPIDYKIPTDGGGGYNPPAESEIVETQQIINNLTDTCQRAVANRIVEDG